MFNQYGSRHQFQPSGSHPQPFSSAGNTAGSTPSYQAAFKPSFLGNSPHPDPHAAATFNHPHSTPLTRNNFSTSHEYARASLVDPVKYGIPMTKSQRLAAAWYKRLDPFGHRNTLQTNERIYGKPAPHIQPTNHLNNFTGPRRQKFGQ